MSIILDTLVPALDGWRPDIEAHNEAMLLECLQLAARMVASRTHTLRELVAFAQPAGSAFVSPFPSGSDKECLRVFALRTDPTEPETPRWLHEVTGHRIQGIQDPNLLPLGTPTLFTPIPGGAVLNARPEAEFAMVAMASFTLPLDTSEWPFPASAEEAIVALALSSLLERPGKNRDQRTAQQKRVQASALLTNLYNQTIAGFAQGDYRFGLPMPAMPVPMASDNGGGITPPPPDLA